MDLHISHHAIERYQQRVENVSDAEATQALQSPAILTAARFGAPYVKLSGRQRVVLSGLTVVTVLPSETPSSRLGSARDGEHRRG